MDDVIKGFVEIDECNAPFQYENGILNIFPINQQKWKQGSFDRLKKMLEKINNGIEHKWISKHTIRGITSNRSSIIFFCNGEPSNNDGFESYEIECFLIYDDKKISPESIDGIILTGKELDYFYLPAKAFESTITFEGNDISAFIVKANKVETITLPEFTIQQDVKIQPSLRAIPTMHTQSETPVTAKAEVVLQFSKPLPLEDTIDVMFQFKTFLRYVCYRRNVGFKEISIFSIVATKRERCGEIIFNENSFEEVHPKKKSRILAYDLLLDKSSMILQAIADGSMYFEHQCNTIDDTSHFGIDRIILLFVAFEREYRNIYGTDANRSELYHSTKAELCDTVSASIENSIGKKKKYLTSFLKLIQKADNSFGERLKSAINNCGHILEPFLLYHYHISTDECISDIADRMNQIRNDVAHGNIDLQIEPINLSDLNIIEILLYAIRLNHIGVKSKKIQQMICNLFGYNIYIE